MQYLIILLIFLFPCAAGAMPNAEKVKTYILEAEKYDNDTELSKIQYAIGMIESDFGRIDQLVGDNNHSFGVFQIQAPTAQYIASKHNIPLPHSKTDIKALLIENEPLAVLLNRLLLKDLILKYHDLRLAVIAYNQGAEGVDKQLRNKTIISESYYNRFKKYYKGNYFDNNNPQISEIPINQKSYSVSKEGFIIPTNPKEILLIQVGQ